MKLEIINPDKKLFEGEAKSIVVPGSEGSLGILNNHAPMIASLKKGTIKVTDSSSQIHKFVPQVVRTPVPHMIIHLLQCCLGD